MINSENDTNFDAIQSSKIKWLTSMGSLTFITNSLGQKSQNMAFIFYLLIYLFS